MAQWSKKIGNIVIEGGWFVKNSVSSARVSFQNRFSHDPAIVVTSEWNRGGVGYVETLHDVTPDGFEVHSSNRASDYYVNWIAFGYAAATEAALSNEMRDALSAFNALADEAPARSTKGDDADAVPPQTKN